MNSSVSSAHIQVSTAGDYWKSVAKNRFEQLEHTLNPSRSDASALDAELEALNETTRGFLKRRNEVVPVSRLPAELLATVFELVKHEALAYLDGKTTGEDDTEANVSPAARKLRRGLRWVYVSHVCREWRRIALDHAVLWAEINHAIMRRRWSSEMLRRSKGAALELVVGYHNSKADLRDTHGLMMESTREFLREVNNTASPRVQYFSLYGIRLDEALSEFTSPLPALASFRVQNTGREKHIPFPPQLLEFQAPNLAILTIVAISLPPPSLWPFRSLTIFEFQVVDPWMRDHPSRILDIIQHMPHLRDLYYTEECRAATSNVEDNVEGFSQDAELPESMNKIYIESTRFPLQAIELSRRLVSPHARVFREFLFNHENPAALPTLFSQTSGRSAPPKALYVDLMQRGPLMTVACRDEPWQISIAEEKLDPPPNDLYVSVHSASTSDRPLNICAGICMDELRDVTFADDTVDSERSQARWTAMFQGATKVRRVRAVGPGSFGLLALLAEGAKPSASLGQPLHGIFPCLEELSIIQMDDGDQSQFGEATLRDGELLLSFLRWRRKNGTPLREVKIPPRFLHTELADDIRKEVGVLGPGREGCY
ncbi:hypothetical protein OF83DRAFT_693690 [Amylostereum chailletii]|nr:hypothetical protein OF83DRAFT_693690 [Amylostereum chailletii]